MDNSKTGGELSKVTQHLVLLREEYKKLQRSYHDLERKYDLASASSNGDVSNSFAAKLLHTVANLYGQTLYSDLTVKLKSRDIPAHRFVLAARNENWSLKSLESDSVLDWSEFEEVVGEALLRWVYTDNVDLTGGDSLVLQLMKASGEFHLQELVNKCEKTLMTSVNVRNCVKFYTTADEIGADTLKEHCSRLISAHWDDFTSEDFEHMSAALLYRMLNTKTDYPLHSAIRLHREDIVFLYLVEHDAELRHLLNQVDSRGDLPLDLALRSRQESLAVTLVEHGANPDATDSRKRALLHIAIERGDSYSANFLLEHGASVATLSPERGETALHLVATCAPQTNSTSSPSSALNSLTDPKNPFMNDDEDACEEAFPDLVSVAANLLNRGLDPNIRNKSGFTALHLSVMARNSNLLSLLLDKADGHHVDLDAKTNDGHTALYYALLSTTDYNPESFALRLVEAGAQVNPMYPKGKGTLLHLVASEGLEEAAVFIAERTSDLDAINEKGETAMHVACARGLGRLVQTLLDNGASPNVQTFPSDDLDDDESFRRTPLHVAVAAKQTAAAAVIIEYKINYVCQKGNPRPTPTPDINAKDSNADTPLSLALRLGAKEIAQHLLKARANVNERNGKGLTMLHQAIEVGDVKTAILLLDHGADINALTSNNETPLQLCILRSLPEVVEALCTRGVDMSVPDTKNQCPLWTALTNGQEEIASILVRNGVDTDCWGPGPDDCWQTLLHRAIDVNEGKIANFLIRSGCDLNAPRRPGPGGTGGEEARDRQSPLHLCSSWGLTTTVQTLIEYGANVNAKDAEENTPLHIAIQNQHAEIISLLLGHPNIDFSLRNRLGLTPFAAALTVRNHKAAQAILDKLPTAAEQTDNRGRNFLHIAIQKGDAESVLFLLSINVDVNSRVNDANQTPPLHLAAATGDETLVRSLILAGAKPNDADANKRRALHVAAQAGHAHIVSALLQQGAAYDAVDCDGESALHVACREGHVAVVRVLLTESNVNAEAVSLKGQNPLHVLARHGKENAAAICDLFVECMEDYPINKPDPEGNTALMLAYKRGNGNLCRALVKAKACIGTMNKNGETIFNYQVATKQLLYSLLNQLSEVPPWAESDTCLECGTKFALTVRKHHCRHCGRVLCSKCSSQDVPILKFNEKKPVRVCAVCFDFLQNGVA